MTEVRHVRSKLFGVVLLLLGGQTYGLAAGPGVGDPVTLPDSASHVGIYDADRDYVGAARPGQSRGMDPGLVGQWDGPYALPVQPIHAFLLPTGKVLYFAFPGEIQNPSAYVFDPLQDPQTWVTNATPVPVNRPLFCSGHSFLADGRLLVTGGNGPAPKGEFRGIKDTHIFDPFSETWTRVEDMADGRWYPTDVTLGDGRVLVFSGLDELTGAINGDVELYEPGSGSGWEIVADVALPLYPRMHLLSSGDVFYSGPSQETGVFSTDTWSWYGITWSNFGSRYSGLSVPLPGRQDTLMIMGGRSGKVITATAEIIDLGEPTPAWQYTQPMNFPRGHGNAVILPDGKIFVAGGHSDLHDKGGGGPPPSAVYQAEIFDPKTETWTVMAAMQNPRVYHSTAILLPDARVLVGGSLGQSNAEIYSPPYLFLGPRPVIEAAPADVLYGQSFEIQIPNAPDIQSVVLMRLASVTHSIDMDQRHVALDFTSPSDASNTLLVQAPSDAALAPPGYYMLFVLDADDVPSTAEMTKLGNAPEPIPTLSEWGMVVMTLLLFAAGTIVFARRMTVVA